MLRVFFWELRNGHWNAATRLITVIALVIPILNYLLKQHFPLPESIADLLVPTIGILVLISVFFLNLASNRKQSKSRKINYAGKVSELARKLNSSDKFKHIKRTVNTVYIGKTELVPKPETDTSDIDMKALSSRTELSEEQFKTVYVDVVKKVRVNTAHALVPERNIAQSFDNSITEIEFIKGDYASLRILIENLAEGELVPRTLGAGGLLVNLEQEVYLLNKGTAESPLFHVFGGNFEPNLKIPGMSYDRSLSLNAEREIMEESGCTLNVDGSLFIVHKEDESPDKTDWNANQSYLPVHHVGVIVPKDQLKMMTGSSEGQVHKINICDLGESMSNLDHWIPAAWLTVMTWLYLDAPCQNNKPVFKKSEVREQVNRILG